MITYWLLYFFTGLLDGFIVPIQYLPNASLPGGLASWLATTGGYVAIAGRLMPLTIAALFVVIGMVVIVENADGIFKVVKWIYTKIPGIS
jgi:uncharacterized membrane protein